jgi:ABC-2 type transport system permease protein
MAQRLSYYRLLIAANMKTSYGDPLLFAMMAGGMAVQNFIYFGLWWVYFANFSSMRGWRFEDLATLMGVVALAFGMAFFFFDGARNIARAIMTGRLDIYLVRPKPLLPALLTTHSNPAGFGDILGGMAFFLFLGGHSPLSFPVYLLVSLAGAAIIVATAVMLQSLSFWAGDSDRFSSQMLEFFIILSTLPQKGFPLVAKIVLFTAVPAGFVGFLPVELLRDFSWWKLAALGAGAFVWCALAVIIFREGLARYNSGNLFVTAG